MVTRTSTRAATGTSSPIPTLPSASAAAREAALAVQKNVRRAATGMLGLSGERMSKVDTAWLRMDSPNNLMMINGVWTVEPGVSLAALRERVQQRLLQYPRFRQRVVEDAAGATWVDDQRFDIAAHVEPAQLPRREGAGELADIGGDVGIIGDRERDVRAAQAGEEELHAELLRRDGFACVADAVGRVIETREFNRAGFLA